MRQDEILAVQRIPYSAFIMLLIRGAVLLGVIAWIALIYVASIGYRDERMGQMILAGSFGLALAALIFARPQFGAYILMITTYTNISTILTKQGAPSVYKLLLALILITLFAYYLIRRRTAVPLPGRFEWLIVGYLAVQMLSSLFARDHAAAQILIEDQAKDLVVIYSIIYSLYRPNFLKHALWFVVLTITVLALMGAYQVLTGNYHQTFFDLSRTSLQAVVRDSSAEHRLGGPLGRPNFWGQMLAAALPIVIYLFVLEKRLVVKGLLIGVLFSIIFAIFYTYSRGAFIALLIIQTLILLERKIRLDAVLVLVVTILVSVQILSPTQLERLSSILVLAEGEDEGIKQDSSFRGRTAEMRAGLLMFGDSPFVGVGIGNYEANYLDYAARVGLETRNEQRQPHSLYIEILAEMGLLGATVFAVLFLALFTELHRLRRRLKVNAHEAYILATALQMSILSYLVSSLFLHGAYMRQLWALVALAVAAIYLFEHDRPTVSEAGV